MTRSRLPPLFLVSGAAVGFETALTRYFAVSKWSEYGYWVISIVMVGFAFSGVTVTLTRDTCLKHGQRLLNLLPLALLCSATAGFWGVTVNPFNPLQLQNASTYAPQLFNISFYYAALLPFFFLTGLYVSLCFVVDGHRVAQVYGADLLGAAAGSALVFGLMFVVHPFLLVPALLVPLAAACWCGSLRAGMAGTVGLVICEAALLLGSHASYNDFKSIYVPLHVADSHVVAQVELPRGLYVLLDDFTERVDTDVSNDLGLLKLPGPPRAYGLYRDGTRIAGLAKPGQRDGRYATATLAALPYLLKPQARVLLAGVSGGFRITEALALGAHTVEALEPDPVIAGALQHGLGGSPGLASDERVRWSLHSPLAAAALGLHYGIIDIAGDFLDNGDARSTVFTVEALAADLAALDDDGILSIPVSIRDFPAYALRVLATARAALRVAGAAEPAKHVMIYRSAWNARVLISPAAWTPERIAASRRWCDDRSFDMSYYPGIDVTAARAGLYNDLPAVSFDNGTVTSGSGADDAIADEAQAVLDGQPSASSTAFALSPATLDRASYYDVLRLSHLGTILRRLEILPQPEISQLVNLAVLSQAAVIAMLVVLIPILADRRFVRRSRQLLRPILYFASLGLGFLFIEIAMIERATLYLDDRMSAFSLVLTTMLVFSGLGSLLSNRLERRGVVIACSSIILWCAAATLELLPCMLATLDWPWTLRAVMLVLVISPVSIALGIPFALGLQRLGSTQLLPFSWAVNGAFSVVATPLANLIATQYGVRWVIFCGGLLYLLCLLTHDPVERPSGWKLLHA